MIVATLHYPANQIHITKPDGGQNGCAQWWRSTPSALVVTVSCYKCSPILVSSTHLDGRTVNNASYVSRKS